MAEFSARHSGAEFSRSGDDAYHITYDESGLELEITADFEAQVVRYDYKPTSSNSAGVPKAAYYQCASRVAAQWSSTQPTSVSHLKKPARFYWRLCCSRLNSRPDCTLPDCPGDDLPAADPLTRQHCLPRKLARTQPPLQRLHRDELRGDSPRPSAVPAR